MIVSLAALDSPFLFELPKAKQGGLGLDVDTF